MSNFQTDILIIGAGPIGLFTIFQAGMLGMQTHIIDALPEIGGQCVALYPEKPIYDIPAFKKINGADLIDNLYNQAKRFNPVFHLGQIAQILKKTADGWCVTTSSNIKITAKVIIIAAGAGAFGAKKPPIVNIEEYENKSVFYMVKKKENFKGKKIAIVGGGDSAVDWAIELADIAEHIYFIHRRNKFRAAPKNVTLLHELASMGKIEMTIPYQLDSLEGADGVLKNINIKTLKGEKKSIAADILLAFFGIANDVKNLENWGINMHMGHIKINQATTETNLQGVFAIGDIAEYENKLKLILTGFAEAATATHIAYNIVNPDVALHFEHSTSKDMSI